MKLTNKFISYILTGIILLLALDGYLSVQRETELFVNNMKRDALLLGHALKGLVAEVWQSGGQKRVLEFIERANKEEHQIGIRWIGLEASPGASHELRISREGLIALTRGEEISYKEEDPGGGANLYTYIPVPVKNKITGALELTESLSDLREYTRESIVRSMILTFLMALVSWFILWTLGTKLIKIPLEKLAWKTKRIGVGDFSVDLALPGKDELSELAAEINNMCEQLGANRKALHAETEARISILEQLRHSERLAILGRVSSGIAHEMGTPLNVVAGRAKLITAEDMDRKEIVRCADIIRDQAERMTKIIRQLLDFARRRSAQRSPTNSRTLATHVIDMLNPTACEQGITLDLISKTDLPPVELDQSQIQQVLMNLIMNAIQAMPDGGLVKVDLRLEHAAPPTREGGEKKEYLAIRVRDEGEGITEEDMKHIFEPFFTTKDVNKGTGLGLPIAHSIIEEHGGWIRVISEYKKGACFIVYLPLGEEK